MRICLVNPPFVFARREDVALSHCLGIRSLSASLRSRGHRVRVIDGLLLGFDERRPYEGGVRVGLAPGEIAERIPRGTELVGVSVPFSQLAPVAHELVAEIRQARPDASLVLGGVYPSAQPALALASAADAIVVGEGEIALAAIADGCDPASILGVYTRDSPTGSYRPARVVDDLDSLPTDYDLPLMEWYFRFSPRRIRGRTASLITSRGCPFDCEFCSIHATHGWGFRVRSAGAVLEEVEYVHGRFGVDVLEFEDDNLTFDPDRAAAIFEGIIRVNEGGADIRWRVPNGVRIDTLDERLLRLMARSGCMGLTFGLEHGDPEMLELMNKQLDLDRAMRVFELCREVGIPRVSLFYLVGYPGETLERFERGVAFLERVRRLGDGFSVSPNLAQPYPGTRLLGRCLAEGYVSEGAGDFLHRRGFMSTESVISLQTQDFDAREVRRRRERVERVFDDRWEVAVKRVAPLSLVAGVRNLRQGWAYRRSQVKHPRFPARF